MEQTIDEELGIKGSEARQRLLASFDDNFAAVQALANGIKKIGVVVARGGVVCNECGKPADEIIYTVPPYWPTLRWLMDWQRQLIREEPKKTVEHTVDPVAMETMRKYIDKDHYIMAYLPEPGEDGVVNLSDSDNNGTSNSPAS